MHLFIYSSTYNGSGEELETDLNEIRRVSKQRNLEDRITGILFYENGYFLQAIEGPETALAQLMERLRLDPRHRDIQILADTSVRQRYFEGWNMDSLNLDKAELFTAEVLTKLRDAYRKNIQLDDAAFVCLIQEILNTPGVEEILNT